METVWQDSKNDEIGSFRYFSSGNTVIEALDPGKSPLHRSFLSWGNTSSSARKYGLYPIYSGRETG
jgi:hypothetical protein